MRGAALRMELFADITPDQKTDLSLAYYRYGDQDFERITETLNVKGIDATKVAGHKKAFDEASFWFAWMTGYRDLIPGKMICLKLQAIGNAADRLVRQAYSIAISNYDEIGATKFGIIQPHSRPSPKRCRQAIETLLNGLGVTRETAADGIPDDHLRVHLQSSSTDVADEHEREQELQQLVDTIADDCIAPAEVMTKAQELAHRARRGMCTVAELRNLMLHPGHSGDAAINIWIDDMLNVYEGLTDRLVAISVKSPVTEDGGKPGGPLIRFLRAAGAPVGIEFTDAGWKSRIETAKRARAQKKT